MPSANCFDAPTLKNYLLGKLSEEQSDVVAAHLDACLSCEATVTELDRSSDTLTSGLRLPALAHEPPTDAVLQVALDNVQAFEPAFDHGQASESPVDRSPVLRDYRLLEPLGSGGMGTVYKAVHMRLDRLVAVKLLPARRLVDEQAVARFQREMRVIGQLSHPAIVQATDAGEVDGTHFLVMEYVEGCDLNTLARVCGPLSVDNACEIARQAAIGLEYAHQQGIVHRDIKPSNLMLSRDSRVQSREPDRLLPDSQLSSNSSRHFIKILDLGLALLSGVQAPVDELTTVGQLMGTLDYMAPEQLEDSHLVGPRADIYALAATLYRLLTGFAPFAKDDRKTPLQKLRALATQSAPPIRERRGDIPEDLAAIIDRALSRDPATRFPSMGDFAAALVPWCGKHDLGRLSQQVIVSGSPEFDAGCSLPGSLSPWEKAGVREPITEQPHSRESSAALRRSDEQRRTSTRIPHPGSLPKGEGTGRRRSRVILALLALFSVAALGIVITIETNKGTLIVESLREGVEVRVKKSGKSVEKLELTTGPKSTRLDAGEYEIEIIGEADGLQIQNGKFILKRGDTVVARVTELPMSQPVAVKSSEPATVVIPGRVPPDDLNTTSLGVAIPAPAADRDDERPNPTAKSIDQGLADHPDRQAEAKFREALRRMIELRFEDNPLTDVVAFLQDFANIPIWLEMEALIEEGIAPDTPISIQLNEVSLSTALLLTLRPLSLTHFCDGTSIAITTISKAKEQLISRSYPVGRSLPMVRKAVRLLDEKGAEIRKAKVKARAESGGGFFDVPTTIPRGIERLHFQFGGGGFGGGGTPNIDPPQPRTAAGYYEELFRLLPNASWMNSDGEGGTLKLLGDVLVIRQTRPVHDQIESMLRILEQAAAGPLPQSPLEIRRADYPFEADQKLRKKLSDLAELEMNDSPLSDALRFLADMMQVQILLDKQKLTEEGIAADEPIKASLKSLPFQVVLHRLLDPLQLTADIEEGLLIVTTKAAAQERRVPKAYEVRDLLDRGVEANELIAGLQSGTAGPWLDTDGQGDQSMVFADRLLFVTQPQRNHNETANFLRDLRSQLSQQPLAKATSKTNLNNPSTTPPTAASTQPATEGQPRYDGKSFDEWLAVLDTERSPARLAEAFQALRGLHQDHQAPQVAKTLLRAFQLSDPSAYYGEASTRRQIVTDALDLLKALPAEVVERAASNELQNGTTRSRKFVFGYVCSAIRGRGPLKSDSLPLAVLKLSRDDDETVRANAVTWLAQQSLVGRSESVISAAHQRLRDALADKSAGPALAAIYGLKDSEQDTAAVVAALIRMLVAPEKEEPTAQDLHPIVLALEYAALMGPRAAETAPAIARLLLLRDSKAMGNEFLQGRDIRNGQLGISLNFKCTAVVALARMGKAAEPTLPTLEVFLKNLPNEQITLDLAWGSSSFGQRGGPTSRFDRRVPVSLKELLIAIKARLEQRPAADPNLQPADPKLDDVIFAQATYKLLLAERAVFDQFTVPGEESVVLGELDQKLKAAEQELSAALTKYSPQLRPQLRGSSNSTPNKTTSDQK